MRNKIFRSLILISIMVLLLSSTISTSFLHNYFNKEQVSRLAVELDLVADAVDSLGAVYLDAVDSKAYRFTVIAEDGSVLYDTQADASAMENHSDREEIQEALLTGHGSSARFSSTLTQKTFYEAVKLTDGSILRVSVNQLTIGGAFLQILPMNVLITLIAIILSLLFSGRMSKRITAPLLSLDLDNPTENNTYEELSPVLTKIHKQHKQIKEQMEELRRNNEEFSQILSSMSEGLILLNEQGLVISMNLSAKNIFLIKEDVTGKDFLLLERSPEISHAIQTAGQEVHTEITLPKNGRQYQFNISRIKSDDKTVGTLILAFDITEKAFAERNRQEFTANVSHELKTPLQTIIGSAEILEKGLAKPGDTERFLGNIRKEASRLVTLINDIIRLSQLDEKAEPIQETVDLTSLAQEVIDVLTPAAEKKNITLSLDSSDVTVDGIQRYLYEIIYNLCDNAIRYNKEGGNVSISIKKEAGNNIITVSDTGIGIAPEHRTRIFERFYRVDKSHSKETGGTGLGLSIVKRAVLLHNGKIELDSREDSGTTFRIILP